MGILTWLIVIPFATALAVGLVPGGKQLERWAALAGAAAQFATSLYMAYGYWQLAVPETESMKRAFLTKLHFVERAAWFPTLGIDYFVGVDGISVAMIVLTALIVFAGVLASWNMAVRAKEFFIFLLVLAGGVFGVFVSFDLFTFFLFYEIAVLPMYLLIGVWGTGPKEYSAMKLTLMLLAGSALILMGILGLYHESGLHTFDLTRLATVHFSPAFQNWAFPAIFLGFGVLGALYPFHTWSPDGHASAPTAVSMLHAGVLMKLGGYGALRVAVYLLPDGAKEWALFFMVLTTINIVYGSFGAIMQKDLKYFTAYSSVSHCGFVLFGIATLNLIGLKGAVIQMVSHGVMTGLFFALIGMVYGRTHTRMIPEMGGLAKVMPWLATSFYIAGLASLGLPGLSGFVAESHVFLGGFFGNAWSDSTATRVLSALATVSIVVTAVYVLRGLAQVFQGPVTDHHFDSLTDATLTERLSTGFLIAALVIVGVMPGVMVNLIEGSLLPFVNRLAYPGAVAWIQ
jgi:NADH-quinone oxidoreductase subunit M